MLKTVFASIAAIALLAGCASYHLGSPGALDYSTVYIAPPLNQTTLPKLESAVDVALRKAIEQSGPLHLAGRGQANVELTVRLVEVKRAIEAVQSNDLGRARKIALRLEVAFDLRRSDAAPDDFMIHDRHFIVSQDVYVDSGQIEAEYQATPELARKVAQEATGLLLDVW